MQLGAIFYTTESYQLSIGVTKNILQKTCSVYIEEIADALNYSTILKKYIVLTIC